MHRTGMSRVQGKAEVARDLVIGKISQGARHCVEVAFWT